MRFYAYEGNAPLENRPENNVFVWDDLTNIRAAKRRAAKMFKDRPFKLFSFRDFMDLTTFQEV